MTNLWTICSSKLSASVVGEFVVMPAIQSSRQCWRSTTANVSEKIPSLKGSSLEVPIFTATQTLIFRNVYYSDEHAAIHVVAQFLYTRSCNVKMDWYIATEPDQPLFTYEVSLPERTDGDVLPSVRSIFRG